MKKRVVSVYFVAIGIVQNVLTGGGGCQLEKNLKLRLVHIVYQNVEIPPPWFIESYCDCQITKNKDRYAIIKEM